MTSGSAATMPGRVLTPDCVLPARQYAVACMCSPVPVRARGALRGWACNVAVIAMTNPTSVHPAILPIESKGSIRVPPGPTAQPSEEDDDEHSGNERSPPGVQTERIQGGRSAFDERHDRAGP